VTRRPAGRRAAAAALLLVAAPAAAQGDDRFCPNRPSLAASGCTTMPGQVQVEISSLDWERDDQPGQRSDTIALGDVTARIGVAAHAEVQLEWIPLAMARTRDTTAGTVSRVTGAGDATIAVRRSLSGPDGKGLSLAVQPFAVLPVGRAGIGDGTWSAGMTLPMTYEVDDHWTLEATGEASARADADGHGRHFDVSAIAGLTRAIGDTVSVTGEFMVEQDQDPGGHATMALTAASIAWQPGRRTQLDLLAAIGLNRDTPDLRLVIGGAALF
jgi:hypothetical protein